MTERQIGQGWAAVRLPLMAMAIAATGIAPTHAQQAEAPPTGRSTDFRLPPADDGRAPGVQGPSDNGLPPTGPGDQRPATAPAPTAAPAPQPAPPRVVPTAQPPATTAIAPAAPRRATPTPAPVPARAVEAGSESGAPPAAVTPQQSSAAPTAGFGPSPDLAPPATTPPATDEPPAAPVSTGGAGGTPIWAWLLAALVAVGAGVWYWRRRPVVAGSSFPEPAPAPAPAPAAPRPVAREAQPAAEPLAAPTPAPAPMPQPSPATVPPAALPVATGAPVPSPLVTRPAAERRALVSMALEVQGIRLTADHVAVAFTLNLLNQGLVDAEGLMVRIALQQGSAMPEPVLARFYDGAGGSVLRDDMVLAVGAGEGLSTEVMLPRTAFEPLMIGGKPMLVPVMAFDVTYHWDGAGDGFGQNAGSFVLGREPAPGAGDRLAPLPLDREAYVVDRPGVRTTAIRRTQ